MGDKTEIGHISRAHGIKGELKLRLLPAYAAVLEKLHALFLKRNSEWLPYFIESYRFTGEDEALVRLEGVSDRNAAESLRGLAVFAPAEIAGEPDLPDTDPAEFIGYRLSDVKQGFIGVVSDVYSLPQQDLLAVRHGSREVLIPLRLELIREWLPEKKTILFDLPDGILEL